MESNNIKKSLLVIITLILIKGIGFSKDTKEVFGCWQPPALPFSFCLDTESGFSVDLAKDIITPLGVFSGGYSKSFEVNKADRILEVNYNDRSFYYKIKNGQEMVIDIDGKGRVVVSYEKVTIDLFYNYKSSKIILRTKCSESEIIFNNLITDYNAYKDGVSGIEIKVDLNAKNLKGLDCRLAAYFLFKSGKPLKDYDGVNKTKDGYVAINESFVPRYDNSHFEEISLFIPDKDLHCKKGYKHQLKFYARVYLQEPDCWLGERSEYFYFSYDRR
ncbi:MAG: hypothetical protein AAF655_27225 [Bacteroidota bacterium]